MRPQLRLFHVNQATNVDIENTLVLHACVHVHNNEVMVQVFYCLHFVICRLGGGGSNGLKYQCHMFCQVSVRCCRMWACSRG